MDLIKELLKKKLKTDKFLIYLVIIGMIIISLIFLSRHINNMPLIVGKESYHHLSMGSSLFEGGEHNFIDYNIFNLIIGTTLLFIEAKFVVLSLTLISSCI